ncbi:MULTISPECIES: hypothetical protein [unclassified Streptomyces]|uniref:hypothetical protein n=1 Tax=unclassified Streptomyces TaxID=2593676 RepID=UPI0037959817
MTPDPERRRANASRARCALTALLLTVLALVGGAAAASGAAPAPAPRSLAPAFTAVPPLAAPTHQAGHQTGHHAGYRAALDTRHDHGQRDHAGRGPAESSGIGAVAQAGHEQPRAAADPAPAPRAGTGRAYLLLHAPPPPHDALAPSPSGAPEVRDGVCQVAADTFGVPGSRRGALPGVRGPPGRTAGPTTGHPSCSADPASHPH